MMLKTNNAEPLNLELSGNTLRISGVKHLDEITGRELREQVLENIKTVSTRIEVDLSTTESVTGAGLGALVYLQKAYNNVALINPCPQVRQILKLTRMDRILDIEQR